MDIFDYDACDVVRRVMASVCVRDMLCVCVRVRTVLTEHLSFRVQTEIVSAWLALSLSICFFFPAICGVYGIHLSNV